MAEDYISTKQAAEKYNIAQVTVRKWLAEGRLRGKKVGPRLWRVSEAELDRYINGEAEGGANK